MHTEISIDKAGRVVIPKSVRDELALGEGDKLELMQENGHIILTPARPRPYLKKKGGMWVVAGGLPLTEQEAQDLIKAGYREQNQRISGLDEP